ncbi:MAG: aconitate hydratase, partial [Candidatus Binatia bacterium]
MPLTAAVRNACALLDSNLGTGPVFDPNCFCFLKSQRRGGNWVEIVTDENAEYDEYEETNLSELEPLIAYPSSPGNVVPVRDVAGREIYQAMIGSSANPGLRDFA